MYTKNSTVIDPQICNGCGLCINVCPAQTISIQDGKAAITGEYSMGCGHCAAVCPTGAIKVKANSAPSTFASFAHDERWMPHGQFEPSTLARLMGSRRSCRNYSQKKVAPDILDDLIKFGITAPSGTNSQKWTFTILPERSDMVLLGDIISDFFDELNKKAERPSLRLLSKLFYKDRLGQYYHKYYKTIREGIEAWRTKKIDRLFHGATSAIIVGSEGGASCPHDDALLASQNILLAAHCLGLGSCMIGYAVHAINNSRMIKKHIGVPEDELTYSFIALGYPAESYKRTIRRRPPLVRMVRKR